MLVFAGLMASCAPRISQQLAVEHLQSPVGFPEAYYRQAKVAGSKVLRIDTKQSLVVIKVLRGGSLARLGHDHVVASHDITGYVDVTTGRADLFVPLDKLVVDQPALRAEAGLTTQPSLEAIDGTRQNMLEKVLETRRFPFALIGISRSSIDPMKLNVKITLHDTVKTFEVAAQIAIISDRLEINGLMNFNQTDFGITPFSILGGALHVQDGLNLRFRIVATNE